MEYRTWLDEIKIEMESNGETWDDVIGRDVDDATLASPSHHDVIDFYVWTHWYVYMMHYCDGQTGVVSVPRNPPGEES